MSSKPRRSRLSVGQKLAIIADVDAGMSQKDVALKFDVLASRVCHIVSQSGRKRLEGQHNLAAKSSKGTKYPELEKELIKWYQEQLRLGQPVVEHFISRAREFAENLDITDFTASSGFKRSFFRRNNIDIKTGAPLNPEFMCVQSLNTPSDPSSSSESDSSDSESSTQNRKPKNGHQTAPASQNGIDRLNSVKECLSIDNPSLEDVFYSLEILKNFFKKDKDMNDEARIWVYKLEALFIEKRLALKRKEKSKEKKKRQNKTLKKSAKI